MSLLVSFPGCCNAGFYALLTVHFTQIIYNCVISHSWHNEEGELRVSRVTRKLKGVCYHSFLAILQKGNPFPHYLLFFFFLNNVLL